MSTIRRRTIDAAHRSAVDHPLLSRDQILYDEDIQQAREDEDNSTNDHYNNDDDDDEIVVHQHGRSYNKNLSILSDRHYHRQQSQSSRNSAYENNNDNGSTIKDAILEYLRYFYSLFPSSESVLGTIGFSKPVRQPQLVLDDLTRLRMESFKAHIGAKYDRTNPKHEALLMRLWDLTFPHEPLQRTNPDSISSSQWKKLGFQGTDPETDLRGFALFGLKNLVFFAENYNEQFRSLLSQGYPTAIAGLNVTSMLFDLIGWGFRSMTGKYSSSPAAKQAFIKIIFGPSFSEDDNVSDEEGEEEEQQLMDDAVTSSQPPLLIFDIDNYDKQSQQQQQQQQKQKQKQKQRTTGTRNSSNNNHKKRRTRYYAFKELYVMSFRMLDLEWHHSKAQYMDFPAVLDRTLHSIEKILAEGKLTCIEDVMTYNMRIHQRWY